MSSLFADTHNVVAILEKSDAAGDDITRLQALVHRKKIVLSEDVIRKILQLDDAEGVSLSAKRTSWNEFSTTMAAAVGKGFSGVERPLFEGMLAARQLAEEGIAEEQVQANVADAAAVQENVAEDVDNAAIPSPPSLDIPSPSQEPCSHPQQPQSLSQAPPQGAEFPTHIQQVLDVCSALTRRVENLEHDKAAQKLEIIRLKARVHRLERANKVKTSKLRCLRKVGASKRIESSDDMEDIFNQGRMIDDLDKDERIELAEIYHLDLDHPSKVLSMQEDDSEVQEVVEVVTTAKLITDVVTAASQVSAASATISAAKPKEELSLKTPAETPKLKDKGKDKDHEEINKDIDWDAAIDHVNQKSKNPQYIKRYQRMKKRLQTESEAHKNIMIYLKNTAGYKMDFFKVMMYAEICPIFQARFDANMRFLFKSREEMEEEDQERLEVVDDEDDDVFIEATSLAGKVPVVDYQIVLIDNKPRFKIIRADET
nr:hypothetical protein [Tanacetum cinerariifolium]